MENSFLEGGLAMVATARVFSAAVALLALLGRGTPILAQQDSDVQAVKRVPLDESEAFFRRDLTAFKRAWVEDSSAVVTYVDSRSASVNSGWERMGPEITELMRSYPAPVSVKLAHSNHRVHIDGALAFVEYDETISFPPDTTVLRIHKHHALLKRDGEWKMFSKGVYLMSGFDATPPAIENRLDAVGFTLSGAKKNRDAIEVYKVNAQLFPNSPRVYRSLAEAYTTAGETKLAIRSYEKSLSLDPKNDASKLALAKLRGKKSP
jgi:tetratricopeptide (TPR) repeat protein